MLDTIFSSTFKFVGQVIGETVHQTGNLVNATIDGTGTVLKDISNIPQAIIDGYNEELFTSSEEQPTETQAAEEPKAKLFQNNGTAA